MNNKQNYGMPSIVLPSIYGDALSFYETVCMIGQQVESLKILMETYEKDYQNYTDSKIAELDEKTKRELQVTVEQLQADYKAFENSVNANIVLFQNQLQQLDSKIDDSLIGIGERINLAIEQNNEVIYKDLEKSLANVKVINYFTGALMPIQEMFDYLASLHLTSAITVQRFIEKAISYTALKDLAISYTELAKNGDALIP